METHENTQQTRVNKDEIYKRFVSYFFFCVFLTNDPESFPTERSSLFSLGLETKKIVFAVQTPLASPWGEAH